MIKFFLKLKKKYDLAEHKADINFVEQHYNQYVFGHEETQRDILKELRAKLENLVQANQTGKLKDKIDEAQKNFDKQNDLVNNIVKWQTHYKKMKETEKELQAYIDLL